MYIIENGVQESRRGSPNLYVHVYRQRTTNTSDIIDCSLLTDLFVLQPGNKKKKKKPKSREAKNNATSTSGTSPASQDTASRDLPVASGASSVVDNSPHIPAPDHSSIVVNGPSMNGSLHGERG